MNAARKEKKHELKSVDMQVLIEKDFPAMSKKLVDSQIFSQWIRQLMQNWRQGTVASKGRSDVDLSRKKPWKQKGTGRARAGTARSPLWRGGGVIFGPQPRVRTLKTTKSMKTRVLNNLFWQTLNDESCVVLDWQLTDEKPKTSAAFAVLKAAGLQDKKIVLLLPVDDVQHYMSFLNIPQVRVIFFDQVNAYDLVDAHKWVILKKDLEIFKERVSKWI